MRGIAMLDTYGLYGFTKSIYTIFRNVVNIIFEK